MSAIQNRYDFLFVFDVQDGNPNGDPDAGNLPRLDAETGLGLVTDVCLKRKVRNYVTLVKNAAPPYDIYVKEKAVLIREHEKAYKELEIPLEGDAAGRRGGGDDVDRARMWMCRNFFDVRTFGAVMSLGVNCGQVRGPVQITFARSVDPIAVLEHSITRMAVATEAEAEKQKGDNRTMGRKHTVPYGVYRASGFISAHLAEQTGFSDEDLGLFWEALVNMFDHDRSAARGQMATRALVAFKHEGKLGNAPAHKLFETVTVARRDRDKPPRSFEDYEILVDEAAVPEGVTVKRLVG